MGLTVHYSLKAEVRLPSQALTLVESLRQRALDLPIADVGEVFELKGDGCNIEERGRDGALRWLLIQSRAFVERASTPHFITPTHLIAFETLPGEGCESANFGLCRYPALAELPDQFGELKRTRTGLTGWRWTSFCKTQYASDPTCGGVENFLRSHVSLIRLLDEAKRLGILADVRDESDFWEKRDLRALSETVGEWNAFVAGIAGKMKDLLGDDVQGPIKNYPNFEHLEAEGRKDE